MRRLKFIANLVPGFSNRRTKNVFATSCTCDTLNFQRQVELPVIYKGLKLDCGYRLDVMVDNLVVVELKAIEQILPIHHAQLITYLRLTGKKVGLLINFNVAILKERNCTKGFVDIDFLRDSVSPW